MAEFIVAIELGSSKITGIAGRNNADGTIEVLAVETENSTSCIRKGVVYNIDKTALCLTNIINRLRVALKTDIKQVFVGVGGQSIRSTKNVIVKNQAPGTIISQDMIYQLMDTNMAEKYSDHEIIQAATQEYKVDNQYQLDPVGIQCTRLEGNFLNILFHSNFYHNLTKCFEIAGIKIADIRLAPFVLADNILTENEKRSGCLLVDFGAETTTVSVYHKNILRHMAVIPLGSNNITKDLAYQQMDEKDAEKMKLKYGSAYTEYSNIDDTLTYSIDPDHSIESNKFIEIVEDRVEEIIQNVYCQIPSELSDKLLGGIILTGGGANMPNIDIAFKKITNIEKIRIAKFINKTVDSKHAIITAKNGMMNTALALLENGNENCAGDEISDDISIEQKNMPVNNAENNKAGRPFISNAEKERLEEEKRKEEEERRKLEEEERRQKELEEEERKENNSIGKRFWSKLKQFGTKIIEEED